MQPRTARWPLGKRILSTLIMVVAVVSVTASPALAATQTPPTNQYFAVWQNASTGLCLDDSSAGLRAITCYHNLNQTWLMSLYGCSGCSGPYTFLNQATGRCIDDSTTYGLRSYPCNGRTFQEWWEVPTSYGTMFQNLNTGLCIDDSATYGLRAYSCNYRTFQSWNNIY